MELLEAMDCRADRQDGLHPAEARSGPPGPGPGGLMQNPPRGERVFPPRHIWNPCNPPSYGRNFAIAALIFALSGASSSALAAPPGAIVTNQATLDYVNLAGGVQVLLPGGWSSFLDGETILGFKDLRRHRVTFGVRKEL